MGLGRGAAPDPMGCRDPQRSDFLLNGVPPLAFLSHKQEGGRASASPSKGEGRQGMGELECPQCPHWAAGRAGGPQPSEARVRHMGAAAPHKSPAARFFLPGSKWRGAAPRRRDWKENRKLLLDERLARRQ